MQYKVSGLTSKYTLFQDVWMVEAPSDIAAIEQVAQSFKPQYPEYVVDYARQELRAVEMPQEQQKENKE